MRSFFHYAFIFHIHPFKASPGLLYVNRAIDPDRSQVVFPVKVAFVPSGCYTSHCFCQHIEPTPNSIQNWTGNRYTSVGLIFVIVTVFVI